MLLNSKDQPFPAENQVIEYKEDFTDRIKREIAGFLNGKDRAFIYIGVSDKKREIVREFSIDEKHSFEERISNWASTSYYPSAVNLVKVHTNNDPFCIEVIPGNLTPYQLKVKSNLYTYVRNNSLTEPASAESIKKLINRSKLDSFDEQASEIQKLSFDYLKKEFANIDEPFTNRKLQGFISKENKYSNTALLLSEENPYISTIAIFESDKTLDSLVDSRRFKGSIFEQIDNILEFINLNNHAYSKITGNPQRMDRRDFPPIAIREGLINAFAHRSYLDKGRVQIKIYSDRLEILSPGSLPGGLTVQDVLAGRNYPRNHNVVYVLRYFKYVEDLGTGIDRIEDSYELDKLKRRPKLESGENFVKLTLPNQNFHFDINKTKTQQMNASSTAISETDATEKIIAFLKKNQSIRRKDVEDILSIKDTQANQYLKQLVDRGIINKIATGPKTRYQLNK